MYLLQGSLYIWGNLIKKSQLNTHDCTSHISKLTLGREKSALVKLEISETAQGLHLPFQKPRKALWIKWVLS